MKVPCNVIQDLLPLYQDGVCSEESKALVEGHLRECPRCREAMKNTEDFIGCGVSSPEEKKMAEAAAIGWKKAKNRLLFTVITAAILVAAIVSIVVCVRQTAFLISFQDVFAAAHPDYVSHSWFLLGLLLVPAVLGCVQLVLVRSHWMKTGSQLLSATLSAVMIVVEILALRAAAGQHYHLGMLLSDYGLQVPFDGGWQLLILAVALICATAAQLLTIVVSALERFDK